MLRHERMMKEVRNFIEEHLDEEISVHALARHAGYSKVQMVRMVKELTGLTPSLYIKLIKTELAKKWLIDTDTTISEVADKLGYSYSTHFSRMFKSIVGMSPKDYRTKLSKDDNKWSEHDT